jgi:hypothetical protein
VMPPQRGPWQCSITGAGGRDARQKQTKESVVAAVTTS